MNEKCNVHLEIKSSKNGVMNFSECTPLQIFTSTRSGRRFLCGYVIKSRRFTCYRLDTVKTVRSLQPSAEYDALFSTLCRNQKWLWGVSFQGNGSRHPEKLTMKIQIREPAEQYIIDRLKRDDFPAGINAVIFLLHKPAGQGTQANVLDPADPQVAEFFAQADGRHPFQVGLDSCNVPGALNFCQNILPESLDTCEGGRFSCYIGADLVMVPCSFDQEQRYRVQLNPLTIEDAWNSPAFDRFRDAMRSACPGCEKQTLCLGGCPLMPEIVFCRRPARTIPTAGTG